MKVKGGLPLSGHTSGLRKIITSVVYVKNAPWCLTLESNKWETWMNWGVLGSLPSGNRRAMQLRLVVAQRSCLEQHTTTHLEYQLLLYLSSFCSQPLCHLLCELVNLSIWWTNIAVHLVWYVSALPCQGCSIHVFYYLIDLAPETTNKAKSICPRLSTRWCKPLTRGGVEWVHFRGETPRESDWGCQSIPWFLYTIILYVHVGIESTNTV